MTEIKFGYFQFNEKWYDLMKTMKDKKYRAFLNAITTFMFEDKEPDFSNFPQKAKNELEDKWKLILPSMKKQKESKKYYKNRKQK